MKRKLLLAALMMLMVLLLGSVALAQTDPIVCEMEVSPSAISQPGEVNITITISNSGDTDMQEALTLYSPTSEVVSDFGDEGSVILKAGEVKTWTGTWDVNQHTLDNGQIVFFVKYALFNDDGEREVKSQPIRGTIEQSEAKSAIEVKRTISPGTAREGQTVTVKYDIVNTGTVSLKSITIKENKDINEKTVAVVDELKAGETAQVKFPVTMGTKDLTSSATVSYTSGNDDTVLTETVDEQVIHYGEAAMTAKLTSSAKGVAINETVTLTLELENKGTVDYTDVRVTDETLGDVFTNQELAAGATLTLEKEITLTETTDYQFTITAIDNTGTEVSLATDMLTVTAVDPNNIVHLNVIAAADRTEVYSDPGVVRFTLTIENDSAIDAGEVAVYEGNTELYTFASIPAGETRKLTRDAKLSMAGKYQFTAVTVDALDNTNTFSSNEIQIAYYTPTVAPAVTPAAVITPEPTYAVLTYAPISDPGVGTTPKLIRAFFYPLMIVSAILLGAAIILLIFATRKRMLDKRASEAALDHLDRPKRRDYVTPGDEPEDGLAAVETQPETPDGETEEKPKAKRDTNPLQQEIPSNDVELPHMKYVRNAYQRTAASKEYGKQAAYDTDAYNDEAEGTQAAPEELHRYYARPSQNEGADDGYGDDAAYPGQGGAAYADERELYTDEDGFDPDVYAEDMPAYDDRLGYTPQDAYDDYAESEVYDDAPDAYGENDPYDQSYDERYPDEKAPRQSAADTSARAGRTAAHRRRRSENEPQE